MKEGSDMADKKEICSCYHVTKSDIKEAVKNGAVSYKEVKKETKAGKACGKCKKKIKNLIRKTLNSGG